MSRRWALLIALVELAERIVRLLEARERVRYGRLAVEGAEARRRASDDLRERSRSLSARMGEWTS